MTYHTFTQYNNGLLQGFIDKFKTRITISSISKYQNKDISRQTAPKRTSQATEILHENSFQYDQLPIRTNKHSFYMIQPPLYIYNTYSAIHIIPCTAKPFYIGKPTLEILFISGAQFSKKDRSSKKWKNLFIIFKTLLSRFAPMLNLVIHPSFLPHTAYTLMVDFYIFALSLKNTPKARRPIIQDMHIGHAHRMRIENAPRPKAKS